MELARVYPVCSCLPACVCVCVCMHAATCAPPDELYRIIETMLPDEAPQGRCIELWAPRGVRRKGWVHVAQQSAGETGAQQEQPQQQQQQATKAQ